MVQYALTFFMVAGIISAMTVFISRGYQGRIHDARDYMIVMVNNAIQAAEGNIVGNLLYEYEPYYTQAAINTGLDSSQTKKLVPTGTPVEMSERRVDETKTSRITANQLPSSYAD